jgi:hypothetical protein
MQKAWTFARMMHVCTAVHPLAASSQAASVDLRARSCTRTCMGKSDTHPHSQARARGNALGRWLSATPLPEPDAWHVQMQHRILILSACL